MFDVSTGYDGLDGGKAFFYYDFGLLLISGAPNPVFLQRRQRLSLSIQKTVLLLISVLHGYGSYLQGIRPIFAAKLRWSKPTCATLIAILVPATALTAHSSKPPSTAAFALPPPPPRLSLRTLKNGATDAEFEVGGESTASELLLRWQPREITTAGCFLDRDEPRRSSQDRWRGARAPIKALSWSANYVRRARIRSASNGFYVIFPATYRAHHLRIHLFVALYGDDNCELTVDVTTAYATVTSSRDVTASVLPALAQSQKPAKPSHGLSKPGQAISLASSGSGSWLEDFRAKPSQGGHFEAKITCTQPFSNTLLQISRRTLQISTTKESCRESIREELCEFH
ncbi:hypothetical protein R3P38DRAFT_3354430 [Favolaschia claudopus]|uniref:Uncharacterized protein n=1 Tax=Favolaschia claudopus TaxID=2862362 RepID=A0AAW0BNK9_9AGAR